jgi:SnoaL-like domain
MAGELEEKIALVTVAARELHSRRQRSFLLRTMQAIWRGLSGLSMAERFRWDERTHGKGETGEMGGNMTVAELMRNNFDAIFIELNPVKREAMMREAYTEDCVWIHPGGRLVGIAAINEAASEIRKRIPEYRYTVVGDIQTMHTVGICRWGSGLPGQPFRYTGTDVVEERDGRVAIFYTFIDSGTPPVSLPG